MVWLRAVSMSHDMDMDMDPKGPTEHVYTYVPTSEQAELLQMSSMEVHRASLAWEHLPSNVVRLLRKKRAKTCAGYQFLIST